jgi:hypothetical protein
MNQLTSFYFDQESSILLSGTVTGSLFICSKMVQYTASVCLSVVPSGLDLSIAQPMNLVETPCLLGQCSRPRLLACSANAPGRDSLLAQPMLLAKTPCLLSQSSGQDSLLAAQPMLLAKTPCLLSQSSSQDSLLAQPMLLAKTPCLLSQSSGQDSLLDLAYLSSPIHGITPWPAAIITTITSRSIGPL